MNLMDRRGELNWTEIVLNRHSPGFMSLAATVNRPCNAVACTSTQSLKLGKFELKDFSESSKLTSPPLLFTKTDSKLLSAFVSEFSNAFEYLSRKSSSDSFKVVLLQSWSLTLPINVSSLSSLLLLLLPPSLSRSSRSSMASENFFAA